MRNTLISRYMVENGTAVVSTTEYTDASDGKEREYTLILSLPEQTLYFRADWSKS